MLSDKKNILQLVALLKAHGVEKIVLCPGSRNAPLVHTFSTHPAFTCYSVTDERSAGFFALGLSLADSEPVAVCCTSGTALLNLHPAVAEAYYQQVPFIVISADRPAAWIGQMDGQTLPQPDVFRTLVKKSVNLPEIRTEEDEWYCNRLVNEALLETDHHGRGPVHINIPVSEPLFHFTVEELPEVRVITRYQKEGLLDEYSKPFLESFIKYQKRMLIAGQITYIDKSDWNDVGHDTLYKPFAFLSEHTGNRFAPGQLIFNFDQALYCMSEEEQEQMAPEFLVTYGGHIVSKRLKQFLRKHPPKIHWHLSEDGELVDLYGSLTAVIEVNPAEFFQDFVCFNRDDINANVGDFPTKWKKYCASIPKPELPYSEMYAIRLLLQGLDESDRCALHLANSSVVRYAQLFEMPVSALVHCNRGTSGIEGSLSTAVGFASADSDRMNYVVIGDLSFFYDMNALWNNHIGCNFRILLLNNGGGEIFHVLPGLEISSESHRYITATHQTSARGWAEERGFTYLQARDEAQLAEALELFIIPEEFEWPEQESSSSGQSATTEPLLRPMLLEVFTNPDDDTRALKEYYHQLKKQ